MPKITVVMTGFERLNNRLRKLTGSKAKAAIRTASRESLKPMQTAIRAAAPVKSGKLKRSIKVRALARSRRRVGARITTSSADSLYQGKTFYGAFIEFGRKTGSRKSENRKQVKPNPFMKSTADRLKRSTLGRYVRRLREILRGLGV